MRGKTIPHSLRVFPAIPATSAPKLKPTKCIFSTGSPIVTKYLRNRAIYRPTRGVFSTEFAYHGIAVSGLQSTRITL